MDKPTGPIGKAPLGGWENTTEDVKIISSILVHADILTQEIISHSQINHLDAKRLLELLGDFKKKLKVARGFSDFGFLIIEDSVDLLREANTLADRGLSAKLVDLVLPACRTDGPLLLKRVAMESLDIILEILFTSHFEFVAQGEFAWLLDIESTGYTTTEEILELIRTAVRAGPWLSNGEGVQAGPWLPSGERLPPRPKPLGGGGGDKRPSKDAVYIERYSKPSPKHHQPKCVHNGGTANHQLKGLAAEPKVDRKDAFHYEQVRRKVFAHCGLAGISPNRKTGKPQAGRAIFDESTTTAFICMSEELITGPRDTPARVEDRTRLHQAFMSPSESSPNTDSCDPSSSPQIAASISLTDTEELCHLTDIQTKVIELLEDATIRFLNAATLLQTNHYCCNAFTLLIARSASESEFCGVNMVSIMFQTLVDLHQSLAPLKAEALRDSAKIKTVDLRNCSSVAEKILNLFMPSPKIRETLEGPIHSQASIDYHLHICSLATQLIGLGIVFYTQGHMGPLSSPSLSHDLNRIELLGTGDENLIIKASLRQLTCLGEMLGGPVFVFQLISASATPTAPQTLPDVPVDIRGRGVDLIETWGPGLFISEAGAPYGYRLHAIEVGGGVIRPARSDSTNHNPIFHWTSYFDSYSEMRSLQTFSAWDEIQIGAINVNSACPLDPRKCRKASQQLLCNLGTQPDYWELVERQVAFQTGYYTVLQVGNVYARKLGKTIKQQILEQWSLLPNLRNLVVPWGLQISLCTGIAKRVSLRKLIEDSMFAHVDTLRYEQWQRMLPNARAAFQGTINLTSWLEGLSNDDKICLISIIGYILNLLKETGVDRKAEYLSVLWPDASPSSYGVKIQCNDNNSWTRILQDSESCATFAAVTSTCLENSHHSCRNMAAASWEGHGGLLSTAVCQGFTMGRATGELSSPLWLEDGQRYWVGKLSGDYWVVVHKVENDDIHLVVKCNRFPKVLSQTFWKSNVMRERPDVSFDAVDVLVLGGVSTPQPRQ